MTIWLRAARVLVGPTLLVALTGCPASTAHYMRGPDGNFGWVAVHCRGDQSVCWERAAQECPGGYDIADSVGAMGSTTTSGGGKFGSAYTTNQYSGDFFVKCRAYNTNANKYAPVTKRSTGQDDGPMQCASKKDCPWAGYDCVDGRCTGAAKTKDEP